MARALVDRTGDRYGHLEVVSYSHNDNGQHYWNMHCHRCGSYVVKAHRSIREKTQSCGCLRRELASTRSRPKSHGLSDHPLYFIHRAMLDRCYNMQNRWWSAYGGRGIAVCDRWMDVANFVLDMGERPDGTSIDRINNDGNYEPGNCRWATPQEQTRNRRCSR